MYQRLFKLPLSSRDSFFIFGPRGTGKTQWLKTNLSSLPHLYIDLLDHLTFRTLSARPESLRELIAPDFTGWIVIDEVQKIPELLDEVHRLIEHQQHRFILTGSSARKLKRQDVNLLAGRAVRYTMYPLTIQELGSDFQLASVLQNGLLPAVYTYDDIPRYLTTYIDTYLREEVMQEGLTRHIGAFSRFLEIASFSQGSIINASAIAREVGVNRQMVQNYFSILNDLLLSHTLPPFNKRAKRRLIIGEKFYYFDVGIYYHLRPKGILDSVNEIAGAGLETLFYQSALALNAYNDNGYQFYYWRTTSHVEVDFVLYNQNYLLAFEIKHTRVIQTKMLTGLKHFQEDYPMAKCYLLYLGAETRHFAENIVALPFVEALQRLPEILSHP